MLLAFKPNDKYLKTEVRKALQGLVYEDADWDGEMTQRVKCEANIRTRVWIPSTHVKRWAWQHVSITPLLRVEMGKILDLAGQLASLQQWPGSVRNLFSGNDMESNRVDS